MDSEEIAFFSAQVPMMFTSKRHRQLVIFTNFPIFVSCIFRTMVPAKGVAFSKSVRTWGKSSVLASIDHYLYLFACRRTFRWCYYIETIITEKNKRMRFKHICYQYTEIKNKSFFSLPLLTHLHCWKKTNCRYSTINIQCMIYFIQSDCPTIG